MRRILWAAVIGFMSLPTISLGGYPYSPGPGYVYYSARCGHACPYGYSNYCRRGNCGPYGSVPVLGQVGPGTTIVAGRGYCAIGNGWPLTAKSYAAPLRSGAPGVAVPQAQNASRVGASVAAKPPLLK